MDGIRTSTAAAGSLRENISATHEQRVEQLTDLQVMDTWARAQLARRARQEGTYQDNAQLIKEWHPRGLCDVAHRCFGRLDPVSNALTDSWGEGPASIRALFEAFGGDSDSQAAIDKARRELETAGECFGTPRLKVMHERVRIHAENGSTDEWAQTGDIDE